MVLDTNKNSRYEIYIEQLIILICLLMLVLGEINFVVFNVLVNEDCFDDKT